MKTYYKTEFYNYMVGISWFLLSLLISCLNDVIAKYTTDNVHIWQVAFLRFFFGTVTLIPFMFFYGIKSFHTSRIFMHFIRGLILFFAISLWIYGLKIMPISTVTLVSFTIPIFILILAPIFLHEKIKLSLWVATIIGFLGVVLALHPDDFNFDYKALVLILSAFLFATLDIINKKFIANETMLSMLFYSTAVTTVLAFPFALINWGHIYSHELLLLFLFFY